MIVLFWASVALIVFTYGGMPLLTCLKSFVARRTYVDENHRPSVSIVVCAYNEAAAIGRKLESLLASDYPKDLVQIIVASDGSKDRTVQVALLFAKHGVEVLDLPRRGKIATLNEAVTRATGDILVLSDANSIFTPMSLVELVRPFSDPSVGCVAGDQRYYPKTNRDNTAGEHAYWNFDRQMKLWQSAAGSATSATGSIYALRRALFERVPNGVTDDFFVSTGAIRRGFRLVFAADAVAYEKAAPSGKAEFRRKVRIMTRGLRAVLLRRMLLNPVRYGFYSFQLLAHKVLRRLMAFPLIALFVSSWFVRDVNAFYALAFYGQAALYGLGVLGVALASTGLGRAKVVSIPGFFCLVNAAAIVASVNVLTGRTIDTWEPPRHDAMPAPM